MSEKKAVTIVTQATSKLYKAVIDIESAYSGINGLTGIAQTMTEEIALKQSNLDAIDEQTADKLRRSKAELELKVLENEKSVMSNLMKKAGLAAVSQYDFNIIVEERDNAIEELASENEQLVVECDKKNAIKYNAIVSNIKADHKVDVAQKDAMIVSLTQQVKYMEDTVSRLEETIEAERTARIQIAQADAQKQAVTVNTSSK